MLVDGVSVGAVGTYTFTNTTANHSISASFAINTYTITASSGANGSVTPNGVSMIDCSSNKTYTITANACYHIADVLVDGVSVGAVGTYTFTNTTANHTISASFAINTYTITATSGANGTVIPAGASTVNCGSNKTYTITANACYHIADVLVDGVSVGAVGTYTFSNITANHTISASFIVNAAPTAGITNNTGTTVLNCSVTSISLTATGGGTYLWSTGATTAGITVTAAGPYTVTVSNGCSSSPASITITKSNTVTAAITGQTNVNCSTGSMGSATAAGGGGTAPFTYSWNTVPVQTGATATNLAAGTYTVTVKDSYGCAATASATITKTGTATVSIASTSSAFCSDLTLTGTATPSGVSSYLWTPGGETGAVKTLNSSSADGNYTLAVNYPNGCSANAVYNYVKQSSLNNFTMLATNNFNIGKNNTVNGSIGNNTAGKSISINKNTTVNGFAKASTVTVSAPVTITGGIINAPAGVTLPTMMFNTAVVPSTNFSVPDNSPATTISTNYNNLTIGKNVNATITGTIYGNISIKAGATVTFTQATVNINQLNTEPGVTGGNFTTLNFNGNNVLVKNTVSIGDRNNVNGNNTTFYMGDNNPDAEKFTVNNNNTKVTANVYMPMGLLNVKGDMGPCTMTGKFISQDITSENFVTWNGYNCNTAPTSFASITPASKGYVVQNDLPVIAPIPAKEVFDVIVYPNPTRTQFSIQIKGNDFTPVTVRLTDMSGRVVGSRSVVAKGSVISFGSELKTGTYFAEIMQGDNRKVVKLMKLD